MNAAIIGAGGRSLAYLAILQDRPGVHVGALCDVDAERLELYVRKHFGGSPPALVTTDAAELFADPSIDVVLICTPDAAHRQLTLDAAAAGKAILLEKPVATTWADCSALLIGLSNYTRPLLLGFVLRYAPHYQRIAQVLAEGRLGSVISIRAEEILSPRHAASFFRRWHRFRINNGGLLNAKCSHDLDLLNRFAGSDPTAVFATGGRAVFNPRPDAATRCRDCALTDCLYRYDQTYYDDNFAGIHSLSDLCVYNSEKDIVDHQNLLIEYANGVTASFELSLFGAEENRLLTIRGSDATLSADFARGTIRVVTLRGQVHEFGREDARQGHGGGDALLVDDLIDAVVQNRAVNEIRSGCLATYLALAADRSMTEHRRMDLSECGIPDSSYYGSRQSFKRHTL